MKNEKANLITHYINYLYAEIEECKNDFFGLKNYHDLYNVIRETVLLFSEELPNLNEQLLWRDNCEYQDANLTIASLKKYLIENNMIETIDSDIQRFWNRYKAWYNTEVYSSKYLKSEYLEEDINSYEPIPCINYNQEYLAYYGMDYPLSLKYEIYDFQDVILFIEIAYSKWININKRYEYTKYVNQLFTQSYLPYQLKSGKVLFKGYMSSNDNEIINQKMFEDKLDHSKKLILSSDKNDKKLALKQIIDCLEYLESIQPSNTKQREELAKSVSTNPESKLILTLKNDLNSIFAMTNNYFDIRHNKENTNQGEKREVVDDIADIEYIYNRIYATVQLLSIKAKEKRNGKNE